MELESASESEIEILSQTLERLNIPKYNLKMEENPMVEVVITPVDTATLDIPESSNATRFRPRHSRTPTTRGTASVFGAIENDSPTDKLRPKGINPFGIYLEI